MTSNNQHMEVQIRIIMQPITIEIKNIDSVMAVFKAAPIRMTAEINRFVHSHPRKEHQKEANKQTGGNQDKDCSSSG